jgi:hydrogenase maturation protease
MCSVPEWTRRPLEVAVIGLGNAWRGDDAAGLVAARRLRDRGLAAIEHEGEPIALLDAWQGVDVVIVIDAVRSGRQPGTVQRIDASAGPLPVGLRKCASTHLLGLAEAIELARELGRLPGHTVLYGVEGRDFDAGDVMTPEVQTAVDAVVDAVLGEVRARATIGVVSVK